MAKYGVLANYPESKHSFIFCMTDTEERAVSLMCHYRIQNPKFVYRVSEIPDNACTGDDFS